MLYVLYICTNVFMYIFYLLLVKYKWRVVLSIVMEHQFHCLCCLSLSTGGVHGYLGCSSLWSSNCSTDTSWAVWREPAAQKEGKVLYDEWLVTISWCGKWWCETHVLTCAVIILLHCNYSLHLFFTSCMSILIDYFFASCMYRCIVHACVPVVFVCMESSSTVEPLYGRHHWDPAVCPV